MIVFLTPSFIGRNWTETELSAALNRENDEGRVVVLPIVIGDPKKILAKYPLLRDKSYRLWNRGLDALVNELENLIFPSRSEVPIAQRKKRLEEVKQLLPHNPYPTIPHLSE